MDRNSRIEVQEIKSGQFHPRWHLIADSNGNSQHSRGSEHERKATKEIGVGRYWRRNIETYNGVYEVATQAGDRRRRRHEVDETNRRIPRSDSPVVQPGGPFLPLYHSVNRGDTEGHKVRYWLDLG